MSVFRDTFEQCPRCGVDLVDAGSVRGCRRCGGMWLREEVLTDMVQRMLPTWIAGRLVFTPVTPAAGAEPLGCPSCHDPMALATLHAIPVDRCEKHGIWFDSEELQVVLRRTAEPGWKSIVLAVPMPRHKPILPWWKVPAADAAPAPAPAVAPGSTVPLLRFRIVAPSGIRELELRLQVIKIGRLPSSHLRLADDSGIGRMHAVIEAAAADQVTIIDLGSTIGTVVNGERVTKATLRTGDVLDLGDTTLELEIRA